MNVVYQDPAVQLIQGDVLAVLKTLPDEYVNCVVSSPPYFSLRDYGVPAQVWGGLPNCQHRWVDRTKRSGGAYKEGSKKRWQHSAEDFDRDDRFLDGHPEIPAGATCSKCLAWRGSLGLEPTPEFYVQHLVEVFREVRRVLKDDGTLWLNLGDSFASGKGTCFNPGGGETSLGQERKAMGAHPLDRGNKSTLALSGLKPKDLVGIPWRVAFALQADGWYLRSDIIWSKNNPMPESVKDRPTRAHEYIFLLSKSSKYHYDADAIAEPAIYFEEAKYDNGLNGHGGGVSHKGQGSSTRKFKQTDKQRGHSRRHDGFNDRWDQMEKMEQCSGLRNKRSVWTVATQPFPEAHFATFPPKLIEPCILAGCPSGGLVLDPFSGAATTLLVAKKLNRRAVGIELSEAYCQMSAKRLQIEPARLL